LLEPAKIAGLFQKWDSRKMTVCFSFVGINVASVKTIIAIVSIPDVQNQITIGLEDSIGLIHDRNEIVYVFKGVCLITQGIGTYIIVPEVEVRG